MSANGFALGLVILGKILGVSALALGATSLRWLGAVFLALAFVCCFSAVGLCLYLESVATIKVVPMGDRMCGIFEASGNNLVKMHGHAHWDRGRLKNYRVAPEGLTPEHLGVEWSVLEAQARALFGTNEKSDV